MLLWYNYNNRVNVMANKKAIKKKKNNSNSMVGILLLAVLLFLIVLVSTVFSDWNQIMKNNEQTKELSVYYERLLEEGASLNNEVIKLQDPEYVARYAREKYMYTKDGEIILKIIESEEKEK